MSNTFDPNNLQVIVLESPYDCLDSADSQKLFASLMALKVKGYGKVHGENPLPFATCDFIGTHLIVADKRDPFGTLYMTYKSVSLEQCQRFNLEFPFLSILQKAKNDVCYQAMKQIVDESIEQQKAISYDTGWTIDPAVREDADLQAALKDILTTFVVNHHRDYEIPHWVTFGICKVKTDQFFLKMGLSEISSEPIISHPYLGHQPARAVIAKDHVYTEFTHQTASRYQTLWDTKMTIGPAQRKTKVAA